jgi:hypothetical protein
MESMAEDVKHVYHVHDLEIRLYSVLGVLRKTLFLMMNSN